jgi:transmembrane sensor
MEQNDTYHPDLIVRYLAGEITAKEIRDLQEWLESDPDHQKLFEEYRNTWLAIEKSKIDSADIASEWSKLELKIKEEQADGRTGGHAASSKKAGIFRNSKGFRSLPLSSKIRLQPGFQLVFRIAASILLIAIPSFFVFKYFSNTREISVTAKDQIIETELPDGTSVSLNRGATIAFPEHFKGRTRQVKLTGEAYFSVKHNDKSRFVIANKNVRIEDAGTSFYVNTNKTDGMMEVVMTEGKVSVYFIDNPSGQIYILPGEKADIQLSGNTIRKSLNDDGNYLSWKTRRLVFSDNSLSEVITLLNKVYHSDIRLSGNNLNNCRLTAIFDNQSLESVLNVIKSTLDVSIISTGRTIEISGSKCDL